MIAEVAAGDRTCDLGPLNFLPKPIREPRNAPVSTVTAWATSFFPSIALSFLLAQVFPDAAHPDFGDLSPAMLMFAVVVFAPVLETLIMGTVLLILLRFVGPVAAILISAIGWGAAHSWQVPIWGLTIWWPFLVLSTLFVTWRQRSLWLAFLLPMIAHGMQNFPTGLLIATGQAG
ncbi:MAG: CPBP family intramembrane metalloprotease [Sphingomonas sp.]|nr:CPBP family intramembrane metalloprotease [Sphingomonas sp.]